MQQMPTVKLDGPIQNVTVITNEGNAAAFTQGHGVEQIQSQKAQLDELLSTLQ